MVGLRVLFIGGTGTISWSSVKHSVAVGHDVTVLNRNRSVGHRPLPEAVEVLEADVGESSSVTGALGARRFDAVVNFLTFRPEQAAESIDVFRDRTAHYVHISTAALYQKPPRRVPYLESMARSNPVSPYAQQKIAAEDVFLDEYRERSFPVTIVRPSHTYDDARPPLPGDWTVIDRMLRGDEVVVHGDGTSLWTVTHADDFAIGLVGLLGNPQTFGEAFHIASEFVYSWNQIYQLVAAALGTEARIVHIPTDLLRVGAPDWFWSQLIEGDLQHSVLLDNTKIRTYVPQFDPIISFAEGARRIVQWRSEHPDLAIADPSLDQLFCRLIRGYRAAEVDFRARVPGAED